MQMGKGRRMDEQEEQTENKRGQEEVHHGHYECEKTEHSRKEIKRKGRSKGKDKTSRILSSEDWTIFKKNKVPTLELKGNNMTVVGLVNGMVQMLQKNTNPECGSCNTCSADDGGKDKCSRLSQLETSKKHIFGGEGVTIESPMYGPNGARVEMPKYGTQNKKYHVRKAGVQHGTVGTTRKGSELML